MPMRNSEPLYTETEKLGSRIKVKSSKGALSCGVSPSMPTA